ncbi:MAG: TetR/AcrR family transcriptional regulator [Leptospiraceae bacterium]|nr:TetR/AcrR family transcriptional regulator [Leptospiraceae bacterium]MCB1316637.1 TetR/AcrR family transcriptional regulator [Leptospiraceae bacterium]MCB1320255.1 TetR/AcrR family transcriptional regulator [Leptospiraceae bacterium]
MSLVRDQNSRRRIIRAASCAFARKGYHPVTMREIGRNGRVNLPTIYYFFGSKEGLFEAALLTVHDSVMQNLRLTVPDRSLDREMRSLLEATLRYHAAHPNDMQLVFRLVYSAPLKIRRKYLRGPGREFPDLLDECFRRHPLPPGERWRQECIRALFSSLVLKLSLPDIDSTEISRIRRSLKRLVRRPPV